MMLVLAEFSSPEAVRAAAHRAHERGLAIRDFFTPFPVEGLDDFLPRTDRGVRAIMLATGAIVAALAYTLEWWTAVIAFPFNSGNRPMNSWPVFVLFPFEFSILSAAIAGLVAFFLKTGLPRYHDPLFESPLLKRANTGGFILAIEAPAGAAERTELMVCLAREGAAAVNEVEA